ncbi:amidohydrolase [Myxococcota bacterium]|nr:amidohydrolase [Myxococcota bacterium]
MERLLMISSDCHAGAPMERYRDYLDPQFRKPFDEWLVNTEQRDARRREFFGGGIYSEESQADYDDEQAVKAGGISGCWDPERRIRELEADGCVGEVIFPGGSMDTAPPFHAGLMVDMFGLGPEYDLAGSRAYNRWLAEMCQTHPDRSAGVALITLDDIDVAVAEARWAREVGLRGGVLIPCSTGSLPFYNHPRYEPLWSVCEELALPVHTHGGGGAPPYGDHPGSLGIFLSEASWFAHRPFTFFVWSGVFERHPQLKFVMTEQGATWIPASLKQFDGLYEQAMFTHAKQHLSLKPSEYFARQCFVGASFMGTEEAAMRHEIGVDKLMWGSDYPHLEGTWPHTAQALKDAFAGVPGDEVRAMVGRNAAGVYGFDPVRLAPVVDRVGPSADAF